jgi:hypothetical protein
MLEGWRKKICQFVRAEAKLAHPTSLNSGLVHGKWFGLIIFRIYNDLGRIMML